MSFGGGGSSRAPVEVEAPKVEDPAVQEAIEKEKALARRRKGRRTTLVTGSQGLPDDGGQKKLLGG